MPKLEVPQKEIYSYNAKWPVYSLAWSIRKNTKHMYRFAIGSFIEDFNNSIDVFLHLFLLQIVYLDENKGEYVSSNVLSHPYPATKIMWIPDLSNNSSDLLASSGDGIRLWIVNEDGNITQKTKLENSMNSEFSSPLTSFDWCDYDNNIIGTSSIDTTCTIWDLNVFIDYIID